jgi:outer membrane lipoprotein-sorting protein
MTRLIVRLLSVLLILLLAFKSDARADQADKDNLTAEQILTRMTKVYANCKTYSDSGSVKTLLVKTGGNTTSKLLFTTAFVRPGRFRFEYTGKSDNVDDVYIVWCNGKQVQTWWAVAPGIKREDSLDDALAGAVGVSKGSAQTIPVLLLPKEVTGGHLTDEMPGAKRIEDAKLGKVDCFRIAGKIVSHTSSVKSDSATVWIEKKSFLIRRIDEHTAQNDFSSEKTTTYTPEVDGNVPDKMLLFNPPKNNK